MNYCQSESKLMDTVFLNGEKIVCEVAITVTEYDQQILKTGDKIVFRLTTGAKYQGQINGFRTELKEKYVSGKLEITRITR